jgi:endo-1,4-beta-xylanase
MGETIKRAVLTFGVAGLVAWAGVAQARNDRRPPLPPPWPGVPAHARSGETLREMGSWFGLYVGTAVNTDLLADPSEPVYKEIASTQFSVVTAENVMKWDALEPTRGTYNWGPADALMKFARDNHQLVRGHVLAWHNQLPKWLTDGVADGTISKTELSGLLKKHITDVLHHFKGQIWQWDVVNEAVSDPWASPGGVIGYKGFWYENLGEGFIADAFRWARAADPKALLFYNDYNLDGFGDRSNKDKVQFVYDMVKKLRAQGVPIDGVGSQAHLSTRYGNYTAQQIAETLNAFGRLGLVTALTEVDVRSMVPASPTSDDLNRIQQAAASNYGALLQGCLASPRCISFTVWGFDDKHNWTNDVDFGAGRGTEALAAIYDADYQPKRALGTLEDVFMYAGGPNVRFREPPPPAGPHHVRP